MSEHDARISQLERDLTGLATRTDAMEIQQRAVWAEIARLREEQQKEFRQLMEQQHNDTQKLMDLITINKLSAAMMTGGVRALAWGFGALISLGGLIGGAAVLFKRLFSVE